MTAPASKLGIGSPIGLGVPLVEGPEGIVHCDRFALRQDDATAVDLVDELVAFLHAEGCAHGLRDGGLRLRRELAGDHGATVRTILTRGNTELVGSARSPAS